MEKIIGHYNGVSLKYLSNYLIVIFYMIKYLAFLLEPSMRISMFWCPKSKVFLVRGIGEKELL